MTLRHFLIPVFVQVALTLIVLSALGASRVRAIRRREVRIGDIALDPTAWPTKSRQLANCLRNQFESPILFYVAMLVAVVTGKTDAVMLLLAWLFIAFRLAHAYIHVTSNHVPRRFYAFLGGIVALTGLWLWLAWRIYVDGSLG
ncbi:MAG: MAPEG family protein [Hyphomicrobiaceae bacterium]